MNLNLLNYKNKYNDFGSTAKLKFYVKYHFSIRFRSNLGFVAAGFLQIQKGKVNNIFEKEYKIFETKMSFEAHSTDFSVNFRSPKHPPQLDQLPNLPAEHINYQ